MRSPSHDLLPDPLHPAARLAMVVGFVVAGGLVGALIGMPLGFTLTELEATSLAFLGDHTPFPAGWREFVEINQIVIGVAAFGVAPLLMLRLTLARRLFGEWRRKRFGAAPVVGLVGAGALGIVGFPLYRALIEWTARLLPHVADAAWATTHLTARAAATVNRFDTFAHLLLSVLVLGGVASVGQELTLRGILQPTLSRWAGGRAGVGIWLVALMSGVINDANLLIAYSVFAAAAGYLYAWSGRLWVPIATTFILNATERAHMYVLQHAPRGGAPANVAARGWPGWLIVGSALATSLLLWWLRRYLLAHAVPLASLPPSLSGRYPAASDA
ncbi:MAG: CPBP family intramembrane metalloprotease [Hymenobacteraceae bacterium]|nr:CPBP family intramembrane metalloprotease [Hymenobacteraceae bacterium]